MYNLDVYGNSPHKNHKKQKYSCRLCLVASGGPGTLSLCLDLVCGCTQLRIEGCASVCFEMSNNLHILPLFPQLNNPFVCCTESLWIHNCVQWRELSFLLVSNTPTLAVEVTDFLHFNVLFKCYH